MAAAIEHRISNPAPDFDKDQTHQQQQTELDASSTIAAEYLGCQANEVARQLKSDITQLLRPQPAQRVLECLERLLQHPVMTRLHDVAQLGYVWPTSREDVMPSYSRLYHSIRVMASAARALCALVNSMHEDPASQHAPVHTLLSILVAALLHDVGHGPLSHTFECAAAPGLLALQQRTRTTKWKHEKQGELMISLLFRDKALQAQLQQLNQDDINDMIDCKRLVQDKAYKKNLWMYQIVCNDSCGLDVDFLTYIHDDAQRLLGIDVMRQLAAAYGGSHNELFLPLIQGMQVVGNQICWHESLLPLVLMTLRLRCYLHFYGYQEPVAKAKELMLLRAMVMAADAGVKCFAEMLQEGKESVFVEEAREDKVQQRILEAAQRTPTSQGLALARELVLQKETHAWPMLCEVWISPDHIPSSDQESKAWQNWEKTAVERLEKELPERLARPHYELLDGCATNNGKLPPKEAPVCVYTYKVDHKSGFQRPLDTVPVYVECGGRKHQLPRAGWADKLPCLKQQVDAIATWQGGWRWLVCRLYLTEPTNPRAVPWLQQMYAEKVPKLLPDLLGEGLRCIMPRDAKHWLQDIISRGPACCLDFMDQSPAGPQVAFMNEH